MRYISEKLIKALREQKDPIYCITIECTSQAAKETLLPLLEHLKSTVAVGHSFPIVVDPDDSDHRKEFGMDGDGAAHIISIKTEKVYK